MVAVGVDSPVEYWLLVIALVLAFWPEIAFFPSWGETVAGICFVAALGFGL